MDPAHFDLNDIEHEPTDEQLAALMEAVAEEARRRNELVERELYSANAILNPRTIDRVHHAL
jgi:hypothetical protein